MRKLISQYCKNSYLLVLLIVFFFYTARAESLSAAVALIEEFEEVYLTVDFEEQERPLQNLLVEAEKYRDQNSSDAEAWIASALIRSAYAATQGLKSLGMLKTARTEFEKAIELDAQAMDGYSQAFLGRLYFMLPSWPLSYGSNKKAESFLREALTINPDTMANNYYYGSYLVSKNQYQEARQYLLKAKSAAPRPELPYWDAVLLEGIESELNSIADEL